MSIFFLIMFEIVEVIVEEGVVRIGFSIIYLCLILLLKGIKVLIIGKEGDYLCFDYGGWIKVNEIRIFIDVILLCLVIWSVIVC